MTAHVTVKIPKELTREMDALIGKHGFRSRGEIAKEAIRKLLTEYRTASKLSHFNLSEHGVRIFDPTINSYADIYFKPDGLSCDFCKRPDCRHVAFALTVSDIQEIIRKKRADGWQLPEV